MTAKNTMQIKKKLSKFYIMNINYYRVPFKKKNYYRVNFFKTYDLTPLKNIRFNLDSNL